MNVGLYDRRVHAKFLTIFQTQIHCRLHDQLIDGLQRLRSQSVKGTVESTVLGHRLAVEIRELTQSVAVSDPFAQLAKLPIGETDLRLRSSRHASVLRFFRSLISLPFQRLDIARCGLVEEFLQSTPVV